MAQTEVQFNGFKWVDMVNPTKKVLEQTALELEVPRKLLLNCLDPDYLPHIETYGSVLFVVLRLMEPKPDITADTVQELTTKVALFIGPDKIISIHRLPLKHELQQIQEKIESSESVEVSKLHVLSYFF